MKLPLFLKVFNSPFKPFLPKFYIGKTAVYVPVFLPRVWRKVTTAEAIIRATKSINNPILIQKSFGEWVEHHKQYLTAKGRKIGFDFIDLVWKTKYDSFRHEYNPVWSFVLFGYQIALIFRPEHDTHYWEAFLYYVYDTDKSKSVKERIKEARKKLPNIWTRHSNEGEVTTDYWTKILKKKYL